MLILLSIGPDIPLPAKIALGALIAAQIAVQLFALVDLIRRPATLVGGPKLLWAAVILFGNLLGAVLYLVIGRKLPPTTADQPYAENVTERAKSTADILYGHDKRA